MIHKVKWIIMFFYIWMDFILILSLFFWLFLNIFFLFLYFTFSLSFVSIFFSFRTCTQFSLTWRLFLFFSFLSFFFSLYLDNGKNKQQKHWKIYFPFNVCRLWEYWHGIRWIIWFTILERTTRGQASSICTLSKIPSTRIREGKQNIIQFISLRTLPFFFYFHSWHFLKRRLKEWKKREKKVKEKIWIQMTLNYLLGTREEYPSFLGWFYIVARFSCSETLEKHLKRTIIIVIFFSLHTFNSTYEIKCGENVLR